MTADELAASIVRVHELKPGVRYLLCLKRGALSVSMMQQLLHAFKTHWNMEPMLIRVDGDPDMVLKVIDLGDTGTE